MKTLWKIALGLSLLVGPAASAGENQVKNPSMENGPGSAGPNDRLAAEWTFFGPTVERSAEANFTPGGGWSFKAFGSDTTVGAYQDVPAAPGQSVTLNAMLYTRGNDRIGGDAAAKLKIEFYDAAEQRIGDGVEVTILDSSSTPDVWTPGSVGPVVAPAGTVAARAVCVWTYSAQSLGSAYWDDCAISIDSGPNALLNGDFEEPGVGTGPNPTGITNWLGFGFQEKSDEQAYVGDYSAKVVVGGDFGSAFSGIYQDFGVFEAGDRIHLTAYVLNPSVGGLEGSAAAAMKLEFYPTDGSENPPPEEFLGFDENSPLDEWVLVSYTTTVPADITLARIVLVANDTSADNGPVYMESAFVERSSQPGVNQLQNASFESGTSGPNGLTNWTEFRGIGCQARKNAFEVPALDGLSVLKISGSCVAGIYQEIGVTPGESLTISAFCRSRSDDPFNDPGAQAGVKVEWRSGLVPPWVDIGDAPNNTIFADAPTDVWLPIEIDYTMPPGTAAEARVTLISAQGSAVESAVYFDLCLSGRVSPGPSGTRRQPVSVGQWP